MKTLLTLSFLIPTLALAQRAGIDGPTPGYLFDAETRELRPLRGFPGAAYLAEALIKDADNAAVSADGSLAVTLRGNALELTRHFDSANPVTVPLGQAEGDVIFAWRNHDLAVYAESAHTLTLYRNLDQSGEPAETRLLNDVQGDVSSLLFDGATVLLTAKGGLYRSTAGATARLVDLADPTAPALHNRDLFVADRATGDIWHIADYAAAATPAWFAASENPVGLRATRDGLLVASAASHSIDRFDLASKARVASAELDFTPAGLAALSDSNLTLLTSASKSDPLFLLNSAGDLQIFFVPAGREQ
jgi:hypothetical protein